MVLCDDARVMVNFLIKKLPCNDRAYVRCLLLCRQDAQFTIGRSNKMAVAFWYPVDGKPWYGYGHYSINCDWVTVDISPGSSMLSRSSASSSGSTAIVFALLLSVVSLCASAFLGYIVLKPRGVPYTPVENQ